MVVQITAQKLRENDGEVISEQHLFIVGEDHDVQKEEILTAIDYAEQNIAEVGRKLYTCPKMLVEIMDVLRDKCSGRIQMMRSVEDLPFASEIIIDDHYVLTMDGKDMFTTIEHNGKEVVDDELANNEDWQDYLKEHPEARVSVGEAWLKHRDKKEQDQQAHLFSGVRSAPAPAPAPLAPNGTMWASGSRSPVVVSENVKEETETGTMRPAFE